MPIIYLKKTFFTYLFNLFIFFFPYLFEKGGKITYEAHKKLFIILIIIYLQKAYKRYVKNIKAVKNGGLAYDKGQYRQAVLSY